MKIAYDATVVHGAKSGVGYYAQELIRALAQLDGPERYWAFSHRPLSGNVVEPSPRVTFSMSGFFRARALYLHGRLPRLLEDAAPDLVHYTNFLAPFHSRHPYVITIHDMSLETGARWHPIAKRLYTRRLVPRSAGGARFVITNSEYSKWAIVSHLGIPEDRIRVTPLAPSPIFGPPVRAERTRVRDRYALDRPYFLYVGNIDPRKNLVRLLEAFSDFRRDFDLVIAGREWFGGREVRKAIRRLGLDHAVRILGYVPRTDVGPLMGESTAFVYPSLLEGFGMPVLEAMASGAPVVTSRTTALGEVAGDAARLVDPENAASIAEAMSDVARNPELRRRLVDRGFRRSGEFSWRATALATRAVYREAADRGRATRFAMPQSGPTAGEVLRAVDTTCRYAAHFGFPLTPEEIHERLFGVAARLDDVREAIGSAGLPSIAGYVTASASMVETRSERERKTRETLERRWSALEFVAGIPFVRMVALSGATAHGNMADEDIDLFAVVEDGRLWFVLALTTAWSKMRGLRKTICLNYLVSNRFLPLPDTDPFTAQQLASLKPVYGKDVYDAFVGNNPFVFRAFPNFQPDRHRSRYPEIRHRPWKRWLEILLKPGPVQLAEALSAGVLGAHLRRKARRAGPQADVVFDSHRIKLHMKSHRDDALSVVGRAAGEPAPLVLGAVAGMRTPRVGQRPEKDVQVQRR